MNNYNDDFVFDSNDGKVSFRTLVILRMFLKKNKDKFVSFMLGKSEEKYRLYIYKYDNSPPYCVDYIFVKGKIINVGLFFKKETLEVIVDDIRNKSDDETKIIFNIINALEFLEKNSEFYAIGFYAKIDEFTKHLLSDETGIAERLFE